MNSLLLSSLPAFYYKVYTIYEIYKRKEIKLAFLSMFAISIFSCTILVSTHLFSSYQYNISYFRVFFFGKNSANKILTLLS